MIELLQTTYKDIKKFNKREWRQADKEHYGKDVSWKEKKFVFKAVDRRKTVGTLKLLLEGNVAEVDTVIVAKNSRGKGIGKQLMLKAEEVAKKLGGHKMYLITGKGWDAIKLYESLGYKKTGHLSKHYFKRDFIEFTKFI